MPDEKFETFDGKEVEIFDTENEQNPENYHETHNHSQTLMSEVINLKPFTNAVPMWGDGSALAHNSSAWGGFFSARSIYVDPSKNQFTHYGEAAVRYADDNPPEEDFDCQLIGLEVDVLNMGKPGVYPNKAKHGITVVGFGNPNSHAVSIICENFDCPPEMRRGQFEAGVYFQNSIHPGYGRLIVSDFSSASIGLDFRCTLFDAGAIQLKTVGIQTGIVFNEGRGGQIYAGSAESASEGLSVGGKEPSDWLTLRMAEGGFRIEMADGSKDAFAIDQTGKVYIGDILLEDLIEQKVLAALERMQG